ncbi:MAG: hypothetical protein EZS28_011018 [Streblomastix strix]|uniref:Protein kinase domain-containing protein n=1 Tax=Streblomastix strix TaxID=222440 RepID=A0A5J4WFQ4_9EUKA|nr:MAG: hypothetical protein EZS28_011018 [Streblomastix strix]
MEESQLLESQGFQVLKTLGKGSFGQVFQVYHPEMGLIAAKVMENENFDVNEWNVAGILNEDHLQPCPFITLEGLRYIHSKGIVHRDIKPANILMHNPLGSGRVICKIADFGEVKIKQNTDISTTLMTYRGTQVYMPPEIMLGDQNEMKQASSTV